MTRDELLTWLDERVGVFVTVSTNLGPYGATAPLFETSGNLQRKANPGGGAYYLLGDATLDVSELNDAQVEGAQAFQGDWDGVDIPLGAK